MNKQLIAAKTGVLLLAASIAGASVITTVAGTAHARSSFQQHGDVHPSTTAKMYKFQEAAIQFDVPAGWQVEKGDDGSITASKSEGTATIAVSMTALGKDSSNFKLEAVFKLFSEGVLKDMKKDFGDSLKTGGPTQNTQNGIPEMAQTFTAKVQGVEMQGMVFVLYTDNPVGVLAYGNKTVSSTLAKEIDQVLSSFKKME